MKLNIAYSSDNNYAKQLGISILSLLESNAKTEEINIYVIDNGINESNKEKIEEIVKKYNRNIVFFKFKEICKNLKTDNTFSLSSFGRIFLSSIKDIDKIIYIDCDMVVCKSLKELFDTDMTNYYVAGVQDNVSKFYRELVGLSEVDRYINAGFLLINTKKWREDNIEEKCIKFIERYHGSVPHHDQGVINGVCKEKIYILPPQYNLQCPMFDYQTKEIRQLSNIEEYYKQEEIDYAKKNPVIIHFTKGFFNRPWNVKCTHPLKDKYLYYMNKSPWMGQIENKELDRNTRILKLLHSILPFQLYYIVSKIISTNKEKRIRKNLYSKQEEKWY